MKTTRILSIALAAMLALTACDDESDDIKNINEVPTAATAQVAAQYPTAQVEWEREVGGTYKAEIKVNGQDIEMYFSADGTWLRTESDYPVAQLPEAVTAYVSANYPGYRIDDADWVETPTGNYFELELERNGSRDVQIRLTEAGEFVERTA